MSEATPESHPAEPPEAPPSGPTGARPADHEAIERLASELLPALAARLAASGLAEIELREGSWKVRLRRPSNARGAPDAGRRAADRPSRAQPGHEGHGHAPGALEGHRSARSSQAAHSGNGSGPLPVVAVGPGRGSADAPSERRGAVDTHRAVATSPAVGIFQPRVEIRPGARVRGGDRIGAVDMLGVPQEVVAPADGIVAQILVEPGETVEYGQDLVAIELMTQAGASGRPGGGAD